MWAHSCVSASHLINTEHFLASGRLYREHPSYRDFAPNEPVYGPTVHCRNKTSVQNGRTMKNINGATAALLFLTALVLAGRGKWLYNSAIRTVTLRSRFLRYIQRCNICYRCMAWCLLGPRNAGLLDMRVTEQLRQ